MQIEVSQAKEHQDMVLVTPQASVVTSESESVLRYLLKKLALLFKSTLSSSVLVMLPLCMRYIPRGLFTKKGCASWTEDVPAVG